MQKVFLPARPANEGARRLAWWLLDDTLSAGERAKRRVDLRCAQVGDIDLARLFAGELIPGEVMGWAISRATRGAVRVGDWRDMPEGGWADRPIDHLALRRAA